MTTTIEPTATAPNLEPPYVPQDAPRSKARAPRIQRSLTTAAVASLSAGAIHAAAIGAHAEHPQAVVVFTDVAAFQMIWGALALVRRGWAIAAVGFIGNAALVGGWVLAKTHGLTFVEGLNVPEPIQLADGLCAALALVAALGTIPALWLRKKKQQPAKRRTMPPVLTGALVVMLAGAALPGMVAAGNHKHSHVTTTLGLSTLSVPAVVPPHPYDPTKPIDLSGVPGVSLEQQARAENLLSDTILRLPQYADVTTAMAHGYFSIGDSSTGVEHYINWNYINDDHILDPDFPESLVFGVNGDQRTLEAAMFMLKPGSSLNSVPEIGGPLTQWHIHDNLCFTNEFTPHVAGLTSSDGTCHAPLVKLEPVPMIHVWIVNQPCGPFAALEGIGGGQIADGQVRSCDHVHGGP